MCSRSSLFLSVIKTWYLFAWAVRRVGLTMGLGEDIVDAMVTASFDVRHMTWACVAAHCGPDGRGRFCANSQMECGSLQTQAAVFVELVRLNLEGDVLPEQFESARQASSDLSHSTVKLESELEMPDAVNSSLNLNKSITHARPMCWYTRGAFEVIGCASPQSWRELTL